MVTRIGQRSAKPRKTYFREWREYRGLTQEQLANRMDTTKGAVSKLESGKNVYNQSSLEAWAHALDCEPSDLISRDPNADDIRSLLAKAPEAVRDVVLLALKTGTNR